MGENAAILYSTSLSRNFRPSAAACVPTAPWFKPFVAISVRNMAKRLLGTMPFSPIQTSMVISRVIFILARSISRMHLIRSLARAGNVIWLFLQSATRLENDGSSAKGGDDDEVCSIVTDVMDRECG